MIAHLAEMGNCKLVGRENGLPVHAPLGHADVRAYQLNMGFKLTPWEVKTIIRMSTEYAKVSVAAYDPKMPEPYKIESNKDRAQRIQDKIFK